jgi:ADP-ribose pyrophosphatase
METWISNETIYEGVIFAVRTGEARIENGRIVHREVVDHCGGVGVVPVVDDHVLLVRQFRIATGQYVLEIPAGKLEGDEDAEHRGRCEVEEEVGYRAGTLIHVASCYCSPGFTNEMDHIYLAFDLEESEVKPEFDENLEVVRVPVSELADRLARLEFNDMKTIVGLRELLVHLDAR